MEVDNKMSAVLVLPEEVATGTCTRKRGDTRDSEGCKLLQLSLWFMGQSCTEGNLISYVHRIKYEQNNQYICKKDNILLVQVLCPTFEYDSEVQACIKQQTTFFGIYLARNS